MERVLESIKDLYEKRMERKERESLRWDVNLTNRMKLFLMENQEDEFEE